MLTSIIYELCIEKEFELASEIMFELHNTYAVCIADILGMPADLLEQVKEAEMIIHSFHPKPGRLINPTETQYVVPDIYIKYVGGELQVQLNDEGVPRLKVSKLYQQLLKSASSDESTNEYVQDKLRSALWLIKSIDEFNCLI